MSRKIWRWIFSLFIVVVLVGLATVLVLHDKKEEDDYIPDLPSQENEVYATSYSCNIPETINIVVGTELYFQTGYINTIPASAISKMTYEIIPKSNGVDGGIEFTNNKITAKTNGNYTIKFKIPKSSTSSFTKSIEIIVDDNITNGHIYQTNKSIFVGESKNVNEVFSSKCENYDIETDNKITFSNNIINSIVKGESEIKFTFSENYIKYIYKFKINIEEQPQYEIVLKNLTNNTVEIDLDVEPTKHIEFKVVNREQGYVEQEVDAVSSNESIVRIISYAEPFIKIEALAIGEVTIIISYSLDTTIQVELKVNVN